MTTAQVEQFLEKVGQDEALQKELAGALAAEDDRQAVTNLAQAKGYEFTPEELWQEVQKRQAEAQNQQDSGELSDEELEAVAGGGEVVLAVATVVTAGAGVATAKFGPQIKESFKKVKW